MAWTTIVTVSTGELATAAVHNLQVLGNLNELRQGGMAISAQAAYDVIIALTASQLGRVANGTTGQQFRARTSNTPVWATVLRCSAFHNTTQDIDSTGSVLALNSEDYDVTAMHDNASQNSRITVPEAGVYLAIGHSGTLSGGAEVNQSRINLRVNGSDEYADVIVGANDNTGRLQTVDVFPLAASGYVELFARASSGTVTFGSATRMFASSLKLVQLAAA